MRLIINLFFFLAVFLFSCRGPESSKTVDVESKSVKKSFKPIDRDLGAIKREGKLTAIVDNSSTGMFLYRGEPLGFEYELISKYAEYTGLDLEFKIARSIEEGFELINKGDGDILAHNLTVTKERKEKIGFTNSHYHIRQVLIQRKPEKWRDMKLHEIDEVLIRSVIDLIGKEVYVRKHSAFGSRLRNLSDEIGGEILVVEDFEDLETESIIELVADGTIEYTVADENLAKLIAKKHPILDVKTPVSFPQQIAWGVRDNADSLKLSINTWLKQIKRGSEYNSLYNKYFKASTSRAREVLKSDFFSNTGDKISPYDSLIKIGADSVGWDWRLLAAQISRESRFDPKAKSWVGAKGLMQVMPKTAKSYGIKNLEDPYHSIKAGTMHIQWLQKKWKYLEDSVEREKFVLASYNVGDGHVRDAVKLAKKYGADPNVWDDNVEKYLLLKSQSKYYEDPVVQFGYCRGNEPVQYVKDILYRYGRYIQMGITDSTE
ncbi:MltF family protein [Reichenbachiella versicolor]|uniref:transglycosylase SLT domain-containing protein n=1 Tax=Reichenbachiella versicolor TaxID=1821036 RepID=UPI000D6DD4D1|nr:transporter substrate-binding domain-containing protein [Reichenbachiella versicolor]